MVIVGITIILIGFTYVCWLLFGLAVHALPFFAGVTAGLAAYHGGSGPIAAILVGVVAGGVVLAFGQIGFTRIRSPLIRAALALIFAIPAAVAGYHAARGLAHFIVPLGHWSDLIAISGAAIVAVTTVVRLQLSSPSEADRDIAAGPTSPHRRRAQSIET